MYKTAMELSLELSVVIKERLICLYAFMGVTHSVDTQKCILHAIEFEKKIND